MSAEQLLEPQQLYELWERQPWAAHAIALEQDMRDWQALATEDRDEITWAMSSFLIGEERVTAELVGLLVSPEDQSEASFLASQLIDEARHMQFLDRFCNQVVGVALPTLAERLASRRAELSGAFKTLFEEMLPAVRARLLEDPDDLAAKVEFVTTYHMIVEGTLAMTGQQIIVEHFSERGIMPGARAGFEHISRDEHRHIAFGAWFLRRHVDARPELADLVRRRLYELLPIAARVLVPANPRLLDGDGVLFGRTFQEVNEGAVNGLTRRLRLIGIDLVPA